MCGAAIAIAPHSSVVRSSNLSTLLWSANAGSLTSCVSQLSLTGVAVEKLLPWKMLEKTLRYDAPQTTFSIFPDIFYPPIFRFFGENGVFQQPRLIASTDYCSFAYSALASFRSEERRVGKECRSR